LARQEYFFPKHEDQQEGASAKRQQTWVKSVDAKLKARKSSAAGDAATAAAAADLPPHELSAVKIGRPDGTKSAVHTPHVPASAGASSPHEPGHQCALQRMTICVRLDTGVPCRGI
jgi:hypothetical protein